MSIELATTHIHRLMKEAGIKKDSDGAYEVWLRHVDNWDEDEMMTDHDWTVEQLPDDIRIWMLMKAEDYLCDEERERDASKACNKFLKHLWKTNQLTESEKSNLEHFPCIAKLIAKTLPDGHQITTYVLRGGRCTHRTKHIKGGKWHKGPYRG